MIKSIIEPLVQKNKIFFNLVIGRGEKTIAQYIYLIFFGIASIGMLVFPVLAAIYESVDYLVVTFLLVIFVGGPFLVSLTIDGLFARLLDEERKKNILLSKKGERFNFLHSVGSNSSTLNLVEIIAIFIFIGVLLVTLLG